MQRCNTDKGRCNLIVCENQNVRCIAFCLSTSRRLRTPSFTVRANLISAHILVVYFLVHPASCSLRASSNTEQKYKFFIQILVMPPAFDGRTNIAVHVPNPQQSANTMRERERDADFRLIWNIISDKNIKRTDAHLPNANRQLNALRILAGALLPMLIWLERWISSRRNARSAQSVRGIELWDVSYCVNANDKLFRNTHSQRHELFLRLHLARYASVFMACGCSTNEDHSEIIDCV